MTRRGVGLIRVSKAKGRDDLISPDLQRSSIQRYASSTGAEIVAWQEALDESGSQARSPWWQTLDHIITRVEAGEFNTVIAWKFNRAARHRLNWAVALDRIERAGATLESATEGVDTSTSTGRFTRGMLAEMAAFEAERIGESWREVKARRTAMGLADGQPRFGYDVREKTYVLNDWAPVLERLYEQSVQGVSHRQLGFWLQQQGAVSRQGNPYSAPGLSRMLRTGFGAGLLYQRTTDQWFPAAHEPVISTELWEAFRGTLSAPSGRKYGKHPLSGLLRCVLCKRPLYATGRTGYPAGTLWMCGGIKDRSCAGTSAWGPKVTRLLDEWITRLLDGGDPLFEAALKARPPRPTGQRRLDRIKNDLLVIARKNQAGFYDDQTYLSLRQELLNEKQGLTRSEVPVFPPLKDALRALKEAERNDAYRLVLRHVEVRVHDRPKYRIVPLWVDV